MANATITYAQFGKKVPGDLPGNLKGAVLGVLQQKYPKKKLGILSVVRAELQKNDRLIQLEVETLETQEILDAFQ